MRNYGTVGIKAALTIQMRIGCRISRFGFVHARIYHKSGLRRILPLLKVKAVYVHVHFWGLESGCLAAASRVEKGGYGC